MWGQKNKLKLPKQEFHTNQLSHNLKATFHLIMNWLKLKMITSTKLLSKEKNHKFKKFLNNKKTLTLTLKITKMKTKITTTTTRRKASTTRTKKAPRWQKRSWKTTRSGCSSTWPRSTSRVAKEAMGAWPCEESFV